MFYSQLIRKGLWKRCSFSQTADRYGTITERSKCGFLSLLPPVFMHFALLVIDLNNWELKSVLQTAHSPLLQRESLSYTSKKRTKQNPPALCTLTYQAGIPSAQQHGLRERARSTAPPQPHSLRLGQSPRLQEGAFQPPPGRRRKHLPLSGGAP